MPKRTEAQKKGRKATQVQAASQEPKRPSKQKSLLGAAKHKTYDEGHALVSPDTTPQRVTKPEDQKPAAADPQALEKATTRLQQGKKGLDLVKSSIEKGATAFEDTKKAAKKKRSLLSKILGINKPKFPDYKHQEAAGRVEAAASDVDKHLQDTKEAKNLDSRQIAGIVPAAANDVDQAATDIAEKVEDKFASRVEDIAVGLREGDEAMLVRAFTRGDITQDDLDLKAPKLLGESNFPVYSAKYLGMAGVAYKTFQGMIARKDNPNLEMAERESGIMNELGDHENILMGSKAQTSGNRLGYVMELAKNGDVAKMSAKIRKSSLEPEEKELVIRYLIKGGFKGLEHMHGAGYVHGDIKGDNMLIGNDFKSKLMDFGTSRTARRGIDHKAGTDRYMAPEVARKAGGGAASDIWSMGETLLVSLFNKDSVDFHRNTKGEGAGEQGKELERLGIKKDGDWMKNIKGNPALLDFIKKTMTLEAKKRATATQALGHEYMTLSEEDEERARDLLAKL